MFFELDQEDLPVGNQEQLTLKGYNDLKPYHFNWVLDQVKDTDRM